VTKNSDLLLGYTILFKVCFGAANLSMMSLVTVKLDVLKNLKSKSNVQNWELSLKLIMVTFVLVSTAYIAFWSYKFNSEVDQIDKITYWEQSRWHATQVKVQH
jgi:hypothetical protein